eukprot:558209-Amphidinium_carterae.1
MAVALSCLGVVVPLVHNYCGCKYPTSFHQEFEVELTDNNKTKSATRVAEPMIEFNWVQYSA